jgi:hypothetical protein
MFSILSHKENPNQSCATSQFHPSQISKHRTTNACEDVEGKETLIYY